MAGPRLPILRASLAEAGQQTPVIVVAAPDDGARYLVIDGGVWRLALYVIK